MATGGEAADIELLRAIAHARMYVTSGRGLESVVHKLVGSGLGRTSTVLTPALADMDEGEKAAIAVQNVLDEEGDPHIRSFLSALIASGRPAVQRLDELSNTLHSEREARAEIYGARLTGIVQMSAVVFIFAFFPTMLRVLEKIPPNKILPTIKLPDFFEWGYYGILALAITVFLAMARAK